MVNIKMIDTQGYGIHKMFVSQKERYLPMPDYDKSTATEVVLTLPGTVIDENYSLLLLENKNMSLTDAVLLDSVQKGKRISPEAIAMLRKRKLIEGRLPHIFIAKDIAQVTDQKQVAEQELKTFQKAQEEAKKRVEAMTSLNQAINDQIESYERSEETENTKKLIESGNYKAIVDEKNRQDEIAATQEEAYRGFLEQAASASTPEGKEFLMQQAEQAKASWQQA